jgi:Ca2+-binding EF-hand superfamily protein
MTENCSLFIFVFDEFFVGYYGRLFFTIDTNHDGSISASELRALIVVFQFDGIDLDHNDAVDKIMKDFDTSHDNHIDKDEFVTGISRWLNRTKRTASRDSDAHTMILNFHKVN